MAFCEALRVAIVAGFACSLLTKSLAICCQLLGKSPFIRRLNSFANSG